MLIKIIVGIGFIGCIMFCYYGIRLTKLNKDLAYLKTFECIVDYMERMKTECSNYKMFLDQKNINVYDIDYDLFKYIYRLGALETCDVLSKNVEKIIEKILNENLIQK